MVLMFTIKASHIKGIIVHFIIYGKYAYIIILNYYTRLYYYLLEGMVLYYIISENKL